MVARRAERRIETPRTFARWLRALKRGDWEHGDPDDGQQCADVLVAPIARKSPHDARAGLCPSETESVAICSASEFCGSAGSSNNMGKSEEPPKADGTEDAKKKGDLDVEVRPLLV